MMKMPLKSKDTRSASWDYYWDFVAQTRLGKYITDIEANFISLCLAALNKKPILILDAGAGSGRHVPLLSGFASWILATEIDPKLVGRIKKTAYNVLPLLVSSASENFPVMDNSMDCILCLEVPYIAEQDWFFSECRRVLRPEGIVIFNITNRHSWKGFLAMFHPKHYRFGSVGYYQNSYQDIKKLLKKYGLFVSRAIGLNWIPFKRDSDIVLVNFSAAVEKTMQLRKVVYWSPWVLLEARQGKMSTHSTSGSR
jgi:SAM-dependent methyltransferase